MATTLYCEDSDIIKAVKMLLALEETYNKELWKIRKMIYECMTDEQKSRICLACEEDDIVRKILELTGDKRLIEVGNRVFAGVEKPEKLSEIIREHVNKNRIARQELEKMAKYYQVISELFR